MTTPPDDASFLGRWSRRKTAERSGQPMAEPALPSPPDAAPALQVPSAPGAPGASSAHATQPTPAAAQPAAPTEPAPPSLHDTSSLTPQSDFKPFMARNVSPEVKNAALKKLFTDPHFNTMDMMDVYVDDYSKPDPMPASMLRQLASAKFLKLFDDEEEAEAEAKAKAAAGTSADPAANAAAPTASDASTDSAAPPEPPAASAQQPGDVANAGKAPSVAQSEPASASAPALSAPASPVLTVPLPTRQPLAAPVAATPEPSHDHPDLQLQPNHAAGRPSPGPSAG